MTIDNAIQFGEDADVKVRDFDPPDHEGDEGDENYDNEAGPSFI